MEENLTQNDLLEPAPELQNETKEPERNRRRPFLRHPQQSVDNSGHILEVLQAAMPYIDSRRLGTMEALIKATDLIHTTRNIPQQSGELSATSLNVKAADIEGMLSSVRQVSTMPERDIIDKMMNYFKARKLYQTYKLFNQNKDLLKAASTSNSGSSGYGMNQNFMEALRSILPPDQAANLDNVQMLLNAMNAMNAMGMNNSPFSNNRSSSNSYNNNANSYQSSSNSNNTNNENSYRAYNSYNTPEENNTMQKSPAPDWYTQPNQGAVPNYTYQMSNQASHSQPPVIDANYMNQFAPKIESMPNQNLPSSNPVSPMTPSHMDPANMNNLYNNITNIYNALHATGLTNGTNATGTSNGVNGMNPNNMMSTITALANSGLLGNNPTGTTGTNQPTGAVNASAQTPPVTQNQSKPNIMNRQNMRSMPIPNANSFNHTQATELTTPKDPKPFNPDELYQRLSSFRNMSDWSQTVPRHNQETVEAASLDTLQDESKSRFTCHE